MGKKAEKNPRNLTILKENIFVNLCLSQDALNFGRGGHGAPLRTKSGRLKSTMIGNPEIRFQANESVQRSISNSIRYAADKQEKSEYHNQLGKMKNMLDPDTSL